MTKQKLSRRPVLEPIDAADNVRSKMVALPTEVQFAVTVGATSEGIVDRVRPAF